VEIWSEHAISDARQLGSETNGAGEAMMYDGLSFGGAAEVCINSRARTEAAARDNNEHEPTQNALEIPTSAIETITTDVRIHYFYLSHQTPSWKRASERKFSCEKFTSTKRWARVKDPSTKGK
jgi:hypothetical protein